MMEKQQKVLVQRLHIQMQNLPSSWDKEAAMILSQETNSRVILFLSHR